MNRSLRWGGLYLLAGSAAVLVAQTAIDLTNQGRFGTGAVLPAQCQAGQLFLKTNASGGGSLYACTTANNWKAQGLTTSSAVPADQNVLRWNAAAAQWEPGTGANTYT